MRLELSSFFLLAPLVALAAPLEIALDDVTSSTIPTVKEAAVQARQLLRSESISTLSTVFPKGDPHGLEGQPIGLMDYYADCSADGNPTLLSMSIATSFKNAKEGAPISLSIRKHAKSWSTASQPRLSLIGRLGPAVPRNSTEAERLKKCFVGRHPDARLWSPGNSIHESDWVTFEVETIYWVGGFGNVAYIGYIPLELYNSVTSKEIDDLEGGLGMTLQRGWQNLKSLFVGGEL